MTIPPRAVSFRLDWAGETEEGMGAYASWLTARDWAEGIA